MSDFDVGVIDRLHQNGKSIERLETQIEQPVKSTIGRYLTLPGLRGFWPMSSFNESGNAYDLSGQGRHLTYNGNPTYNFGNLAPFVQLDGTGDYLSRADESGLDIIGSESYVTSSKRGLTVGGWFWMDVLATAGLMMKWTPYGLQYSSGIRMIVNDGTTYNSGTISISAGQWYFCVGRYTPSTSVKVFVNTQTLENTTSIPASILSTSANFYIGSIDGSTQLLDGRASLCFLCATALSDAIINGMYQQSRALFGV